MVNQKKISRLRVARWTIWCGKQRRSRGKSPKAQLTKVQTIRIISPERETNVKIKVFTAGGTIDKIYSEEKGTLNFSFGKQAIRVLGEEKVKLNFDYDIERLLAKDSLEMTDEDRQLIKKACAGTIADKILITHGTDTMVDTARVLSEIPNKAIVLTGASQPYRFRESDAEFNIGVAFGALNVLDKGVYIAMNGRVYPWNTCKKADNGMFIEK